MALITTTEAAARLGVNQSRVRQMILSQQLPARKFGRDWMIDEEDVEMYKKVRRPAGRPTEKRSGSGE